MAINKSSSSGERGKASTALMSGFASSIIIGITSQQCLLFPPLKGPHYEMNGAPSYYTDTYLSFYYYRGGERRHSSSPYRQKS